MTSMFNFDAMRELAQKDPAALEQLRAQEIEDLINNAPTHLQRRLRGLQFQIDCQRKKHKHPMGACIAISRMMMDSLQELNRAIQGEHVVASQQATIIPFVASAR